MHKHPPSSALKHFLVLQPHRLATRAETVRDRKPSAPRREFTRSVRITAHWFGIDRNWSIIPSGEISDSPTMGTPRRRGCRITYVNTFAARYTVTSRQVLNHAFNMHGRCLWPGMNGFREAGSGAGIAAEKKFSGGYQHRAGEQYPARYHCLLACGKRAGILCSDD
jgi:hypothetical protein